MALVAAICNNFVLDVPKEVIAMASGVAVGTGHSGCMCSALNGGILVFGMFCGCTEPKGLKARKSIGAWR